MAEKSRQIQESDLVKWCRDYIDNYGYDETLPTNLITYIAETLDINDDYESSILVNIVKTLCEKDTVYGHLNTQKLAKDLIVNLGTIPSITAKIYTPTDDNNPEIFTGPYVKLPNSTVEFTPDNVNHPAHYTSGQFETIDIIKDKLTPEQFEGFCIGNVIKYVTRYKQKNGLEDLEKARWYLDKIVEVKKNADK